MNDPKTKQQCYDTMTEKIQSMEETIKKLKLAIKEIQKNMKGASLDTMMAEEIIDSISTVYPQAPDSEQGED